jgi:hypothetical protein
VSTDDFLCQRLGFRCWRSDPRRTILALEWAGPNVE